MNTIVVPICASDLIEKVNKCGFTDWLEPLNWNGRELWLKCNLKLCRMRCMCAIHTQRLCASYSPFLCAHIDHLSNVKCKKRFYMFKSLNLTLIKIDYKYMMPHNEWKLKWPKWSIRNKIVSAMIVMKSIKVIEYLFGVEYPITQLSFMFFSALEGNRNGYGDGGRKLAIQHNTITRMPLAYAIIYQNNKNKNRLFRWM